MVRTARLILAAIVTASVAPAGAAGQLVRGQVVDSVTGVPISQSTVILAGPAGLEIGRTVTDPRGIFLLRAPEPGNYRLLAVPDRYRQATFPPFELAAEDMRSFVLLIAPLEAVAELPDAGTRAIAVSSCPARAAEGLPVIVGAVTDAATGNPVAGANVHVSAPPALDSMASANATTTITADEEGNYAICDAATMSRIALHATAGMRKSEFRSLLIGTVGAFSDGKFHPLTTPIWRQDLSLRSEEGQRAELTGIVTDTSGAALPGATVEIVGTPYRTRTDAAGRFEFEGLTSGDVRVEAKQVGYSPVEFDMVVVPDQTVHVPDGMLALGEFTFRLADVVLTGSALSNPRLAGFFRRRATMSEGKFATSEDWRRWMRGVEGALTRMRFGRDKPRTCGAPTATYIDGVYLPPSFSVATHIDIDTIDAIEAYANGHDAPPEYRRQGCGAVIMYWTHR